MALTPGKRHPNNPFFSSSGSKANADDFTYVTFNDVCYYILGIKQAPNHINYMITNKGAFLKELKALRQQQDVDYNGKYIIISKGTNAPP